MKFIFKNYIFIILFASMLPLSVYAKDSTLGTAPSCCQQLSFKVKSTAFSSGDVIPTKYVCTNIPGGKNLSLPLAWTGAQTVTKSFALLMYDLNPVANNFIHWAVINIPPDAYTLKEGISGTSQMPAGSLELVNSAGTSGYTGPCPPAGTGNHEYKLIVYALSARSLNLSGKVTLEQFEEALKGNIINQSEISGFFQQ